MSRLALQHISPSFMNRFVLKMRRTEQEGLVLWLFLIYRRKEDSGQSAGKFDQMLHNDNMEKFWPYKLSLSVSRGRQL